MRKLAGSEGDDVLAPAIIGKFRALAHPAFSGAGDALPGLDAEGAKGVVPAGAGLHLDKGDELALAGDEVDPSPPGSFTRMARME